jgi:hypothetical protein
MNTLLAHRKATHPPSFALALVGAYCTRAQRGFAWREPAALPLVLRNTRPVSPFSGSFSFSVSPCPATVLHGGSIPQGMRAEVDT